MRFVDALPIRDVRVKLGNQTGAGGMAVVLADFEQAPKFAVVNAVTDVRESIGGRQDIVDRCVTSVARGAREAFRENLGGLPAVRVVVREVFPHPTDASDLMNAAAGRRVVEDALRLYLADAR